MFLQTAPPVQAPSPAFARYAAFVRARPRLAVGFTAGKAKGLVQLDPSGAQAYEVRQGAISYRLGNDGRRGRAIRDDLKRYLDLRGSGLYEDALGAGAGAILPVLALAPDLVRAVPALWKPTSPGRFRAEWPSPDGRQVAEVEFAASGGIKTLVARGLTYAITYPAFTKPTIPAIPDGYVPDALPQADYPLAVGAPMPVSGEGRRLVVMVGDDVPSKRMAARKWTVSARVVKLGERGLPRSMTPTIYLVGTDGKVLGRWMGDHPTIVEAVKKAILER